MIPTLKPPELGIVSIDKESPNELHLTLHLDENAEAFNKSKTVDGKDALDLINDIQKQGHADQI